MCKIIRLALKVGKEGRGEGYRHIPFKCFFGIIQVFRGHDIIKYLNKTKDQEKAIQLKHKEGGGRERQRKRDKDRERKRKRELPQFTKFTPKILEPTHNQKLNLPKLLVYILKLLDNIIFQNQF